MHIVLAQKCTAAYSASAVDSATVVLGMNESQLIGEVPR